MLVLCVVFVAIFVAVCFSVIVRDERANDVFDTLVLIDSAVPFMRPY